MNLRKARNPFRFMTQMSLTQPTGVKVRDLHELLNQLNAVPGSVIYFHTHHFLKQHQYLSPEPPNDFAYWVTNVLREEHLGEQLASIDTVRFSSLRAIREKLISVIQGYLAEVRTTPTASEGDELYLMKSISFIFPTSYEARDLEEFLQAVRKVSVLSLYHHIFEARLRLEKGVNDFSAWLEGELGESQLARWITGLDPYTQTLQALRSRIVKLIEQRLRSLSQESVHAS
jgi:hypothetical protein